MKTENKEELNLKSKNIFEGLADIIDQSLVESYSSDIFVSDNLTEAIRYSLFGKSKRFRPILHLVSGQALGVPLKNLLPTACAIELIHTYSLIHDDLPALDNDNLRRGKPTLHIAYGEDTAIMAGDALFADAFKILLSNKCLRSDILINLAKDLANVSGSMGMVGGQMLDLKISTGSASENLLRRIDRYKTAELVSYASRSAATAADLQDELIEKFSRFGQHLGMAFQIVDDMLDITGDSGSLGKETGSDHRKNKPTYASLIGIDEAKKVAENEIGLAKNQLNGLNIDLTNLFTLANFVVDRDK